MSGQSVKFTFTPIPWATKARCRGMDPNIFMPELGDPVKEIKEICNGNQRVVVNRDRQAKETIGEPPCPVREECLQYALEIPGVLVGIFGGRSQKERRGMTPEKPSKNAIQRIQHGTLAGFKAEFKYRLEHCDECIKANNETKRRNKAQQKTKVKHGTYAGFRAEKRLGLPICEKCQAAYEVEKADYLSKTTALETDPPLRQLVNLIHATTTEDWPIAKDIASETQT